MSNKSVISLFSGALGLDLGLKNAGFELRSIVECDPIAIKTVRENLKKTKSKVAIFEEKMTLDNIESICKKILKETALKKGEVQVLAGAPPCQPFSTAGKRRSIQDERGDGFSVFLKAVRILRPKYFIIENVKGVLSAAKKHRPLEKRGSGFPTLRPDEEHGSAFREILDKLSKLSAEMGYCVSWGVLNAVEFGSPQSRERLIIIGSIDGHFVWPTATHSALGKNGLQKWTTLRQAFNNLQDTKPIYRNFSSSVRSYLKHIPAGGNWRDLPKSMQKKAIGGAYYSWGGRSGFLRRLAWNKPSPTITQSPSAKATMLCHPTKIRPLTVRECARIQQFPDDWIFSGGITEQYRQIGNATPVALAEAIGVEIKKSMRRRKGNYKKILYCADPELLNRMINRPKTMLNPPQMRLVSDPKKTKRWLKKSQEGRVEFTKYLAYGT